MGKYSPMFHPQGGKLDGLHYQLLDSDDEYKTNKISTELASYRSEDFTSNPEHKEPFPQLTSDQFLPTKENGEATEEMTAEIMGAKFNMNLTMLSVMAHVDTLAPDGVPDAQAKACASLRHNCQPQVNERDICLRYGQVHNRKFSREKVEAATEPVDLETTCLGWFKKDPTFHNALIATPMEVTNEGTPQARLKTYEAWTGCDRWLSRNEYVKGVTFSCLAKLYTIVADDTDALKLAIKDRFGYEPVMSESENYNVDTAKAIINVTHFVLNSIWFKFDKFHEWKDFVAFALRLYHIDPDIKKYGEKIEGFDPKWVAIWFRMDELVYFTRIMFNKLFKFRLPMIDGATRKFAADMAILRIFPIRSVEEAVDHENWVVTIEDQGKECDKHSFIAPIIRNPVQLMIVALATKDNLAPEKQLKIWQDLSKRKQMTDLKVTGNSFRRVAMLMVEQQVDNENKDSVLVPINWTEGVEHVNEKNEKIMIFNQKTMVDSQWKFREILLDQVFEHTDTRFLSEYHYQLMPDKPEDAKKALQQIKKTFLDKKHTLTRHRMNPNEKPKCGVLLPIDYLCHWIVHPIANEDKEFDVTQQDIIWSYLEQNGTIAPFYERMKKEKEMQYPRSYFSGNFPDSDQESWTGSVQWATCVQRRYVGFYKNAVLELIKPMPKGVTLKQLATQLLFCSALSDFMETVNEFGHEISVPKEWTTICPNFCLWMKPSSKWFPDANDGENATKTNLPQALALLIILGKLAQMEPADSKAPGILFSTDFLNLYNEMDLFPRPKTPKNQKPMYFDPEYYGWARISFRLRDEPDQSTRFSATRMLVRIMGEDKDSTLLKSIEKVVTVLPKIDWVQCLKADPCELGTAIGDLDHYTFQGKLFIEYEKIESEKSNTRKGKPESPKAAQRSGTKKRKAEPTTTSQKRPRRNAKKTSDASSPKKDLPEKPLKSKTQQAPPKKSKKRHASTVSTSPEEATRSDGTDKVIGPDDEQESAPKPSSSDNLPPASDSDSEFEDAVQFIRDDVKQTDPDDQVTVDFTGGVNKSNKEKCLGAMEATGGFLIMKGLLNETLDTIMAQLMSELEICRGVGNFRQFHLAKKGGGCSEGFCNNKILIQDFMREDVCNGQTTGIQPNAEGTRIVHYLIDVSLPSCLPAFNDSLFVKWFPLPEIRPGGEYCMMHHVGRDSRPEMGPNLYLTFPGPVTTFHMDGNGMVDSAHLCLGGYNEVFMLPRLDSAKTAYALEVLKAPQALIMLPHDMKRGDTLKAHEWPTKNMVVQLQEKKIYPSIFILEPGQLLHIAKGRIHCFRKLTSDVLPVSDVHESLRKIIVQKNQVSNKNICVSVAWDWMYTGFTVAGQHNELAHVMQKPRTINLSRDTPESAIPELCLLRMAEVFSSKPVEQEKCKLITVLLGQLTKKKEDIQ
jgi:hypothetical protein